MDNLIFWPKFGEIAQLHAIFWLKYWACCRELGGGGWSWVELGAQFRNTRKKKKEILIKNNHSDFLRLHCRQEATKVYEVMIFDMEKYVFFKSVFNTLNDDITQMLKKFPSDKINGTKNVLFFLSWAPTHHRFTFSLRLLSELKHKVLPSKTVCEIFDFESVSLLLKFIFLFNKMHGLFDFKTS